MRVAHFATIAGAAVGGATALLPMRALVAQDVAPDSARPAVVRPAKSPGVAAVLGLVLPGAGHWYATERRRGLLVAATYWTGVAIVAGGRTDAVGKVGGAMAVGAVVVGVVDGVLATDRYNARIAVGVAPGGPGPGGLGVLRVQLVGRR